MIEFEMEEDKVFVRYVEEQWLRGIYYDTFEDRSKEIHITDLTNPCLKSVVLAKRDGLQTFEDIDKSFLKKTWSGKKLHETAFGDEHEYAFRYRFADEPFAYIYGSVDEILGNTIIDKKYYSFIPTTPYQHHVEQVLFYLVVLTDWHERMIKGKYKMARPLDNIKRGALMYISRHDLRDKIYMFKPKNRENVKEEMIKRANIIRRGLAFGEIPKGEKGWMCNYCRFKDKCEDYKGGE